MWIQQQSANNRTTRWAEEWRRLANTSTVAAQASTPMTVTQQRAGGIGYYRAVRTESSSALQHYYDSDSRDVTRRRYYRQKCDRSGVLYLFLASRSQHQRQAADHPLVHRNSDSGAVERNVRPFFRAALYFSSLSFVRALLCTRSDAPGILTVNLVAAAATGNPRGAGSSRAGCARGCVATICYCIFYIPVARP